MLIFRCSCWCFAKNDVNLLLFCVHFALPLQGFPFTFAKIHNISQNHSIFRDKFSLYAC
nr:MAG TPA: hypothetical protein [Caudoviricetes sp.]